MLKKMFFTKNVGKLDRVLRLLPAAVVVGLWLAGTIDGPLLFGLSIISGMLAFTSVTGICSIYGMLGFSSLKKRKKN